MKIAFRVQDSDLPKSIPENPPFVFLLPEILTTGRFMSRIEPNVPDSCCISPRFRSNSFRRSLRYQRLPPQLLRLSVLKLDGSSFEVQVARTATVENLRDAVESVFCGMSMNKEDVKISWPHVWGHFCLCYKHYKLIDDKSDIKRFGIRDGDQLHFVNRVA